MGAVKEVKSKLELESLLKGGSEAKLVAVIHFWAAWCEASKQMDQVFSHIASDFPHAIFLRVEAEEQPEISEAYSVSAVPFFVFLKDGKTVETLEGADPSGLANKVANLAGTVQPGQSAAPASLGLAAVPAVLESVKELSQGNAPSTLQRIHNEKDNLNQRLEKLISSNPVMLFMKGTPESPKCGFSKKVVEILKEQNVKFGSYDILSDNEVREGLKIFSNWPTFPQLYCDNELVGGCDIVKSMHENGELKEILKAHIQTQPSGLTPALSKRLENLINSSPVMLFMKGKPDEPKCGFSGKVVEILTAEKVEFGSFDILTDDEVRQGLKVYSKWSSYPQLYVKGELIGGSDIVLEMQKSGELERVLKSTDGGGIEERLRKLVNRSRVMLFMKGSPEEPRCGFSSKVVNALRGEGVEFGYFDILGDEDVRQGLKAFSNWPTFPQLYCKGELVGGCDIVMELVANGELKTTLLD